MNEPGKRTLEKIRKLAKFLSEKHHITLARAISMNPSKMAKILSGEEKVSRGTIVKILLISSSPQRYSPMMTRNFRNLILFRLMKTSFRSRDMISRTISKG